MPPSNIGILFDMDGVIIDNTPFHKKAWKQFYAKHGGRLTDRVFQTQINGRLNREILENFFRKKLSANEVRQYAKEKESIYQQSYKNHVELLPGLERLLKELKKARVPMAIATAAPPDNVRFIFERTRLGRYITKVVDASKVKRGKPYPDLYRRAAQAIHKNPTQCVVFEDSPLGIEAAKAAGAKVVAVMTSMKPRDVKDADARVLDFKKISLQKLKKRFEL